jgi:hypothetical protein
MKSYMQNQGASKEYIILKSNWQLESQSLEKPLKKM